MWRLLFSIFFFVPMNGLATADLLLQRCRIENLEGHSGDSRCVMNYLDRLKQTQSVTIRNIRMALSKPDRDGSNHRNAHASLKQTQIQWRRFVEADCRFEQDVVGAPLAGLGCEIRHYESRNQRLKQLYESELVR